MPVMAKKPAKKSTPVGKAIDWSEDEIARLADVTPEDITSAKAQAKRLMPKKALKVLDAKKDDGEDA